MGAATVVTRGGRLRLFSTGPQSAAYASGRDFRRQLAAVARWSERHGCDGMLIYTDHRLVDPWLAAQIVAGNTTRLAPLVAIQPAYMHPYSVAKMVASLAYLYGRRIALNMVAGGFTNDLQALDDTTPHDRRYERLVEYTAIVQRLLAGGPVTFEGTFYTVRNLTLSPAPAPGCSPDILVSGSSPAGRDAARTLGAIAISYPEPPEQSAPVALDGAAGSGIRVGIIARPRAADAWRVAHARFPEDRKGQLRHQLAMKVSDSAWHARLTALGNDAASRATGYWLVPFQNYKTFCPYLVGSYERVAGELARYIALGHQTFILDIPPDEEELRHTAAVFEMAGACREVPLT